MKVDLNDDRVKVNYDKVAEGTCVKCKSTIWAHKNGKYMCYECQEFIEKLEVKK